MKNIKKKIDEAMISMSNKGAAFARENPKKVRSIKRYAMFAFCLRPDYTAEIIGNIYDNPELVEAE